MTAIENTDVATETPEWGLSRALKMAIGAGLVLSAWLIFFFDPLPVVDLPQHAAQLALYRALGDPSFPFADQYEINYFTPYLLAYLIAGAFALALPIGTAFKAAIFTALVAFVYAIYRFQRRVGAEPWWILLGFPLFFGLSFVWGFISYLMAMPLILLAVELSWAYGAALSSARERWRKGLPVALVGIGLFFAHGMACVFAMAVGAAVALARSCSGSSFPAVLRSLPRLLLPYLPAAFLTILWRFLNQEMDTSMTWHHLVARLGVHRRMLGDHLDAEATIWSVPLLVVVLFAIVGSRHIWRELPPAERWARWVPLVSVAIYAAVMPDRIGAFYHSNGRFLIFLPLFAGWCLSRRAWRLAPVLLAALCFGWLLVLGGRFAAAERELQPLVPLLDQLPPRGKLLTLILDHDENAFGIPLVIHQAAWYSAKKEGQVDFSFAFFRNQLVRYVSGRRPAINQGFEHLPRKYDVFALAGDYYDFWLIYAPGAGPEEHELATRWTAGRLEPAGASGPWWLYRKVR